MTSQSALRGWTLSFRCPTIEMQQKSRQSQHACLRMNTVHDQLNHIRRTSKWRLWHVERSWRNYGASRRWCCRDKAVNDNRTTDVTELTLVIKTFLSTFIFVYHRIKDLRNERLCRTRELAEWETLPKYTIFIVKTKLTNQLINNQNRKHCIRYGRCIAVAISSYK